MSKGLHKVIEAKIYGEKESNLKITGLNATLKRQTTQTFRYYVKMNFESQYYVSAIGH